MNNLKNRLLVLFALFVFGQTAWAQFSGGNENIEVESSGAI